MLLLLPLYVTVVQIAFTGRSTMLVCQERMTVADFQGNKRIEWYFQDTLLSTDTVVKWEYFKAKVIGNHTKGEFDLHLSNLAVTEAGAYMCSVAGREQAEQQLVVKGTRRHKTLRGQRYLYLLDIKIVYLVKLRDFTRINDFTRH
jgi:hypothetical protein